MLKIFSSCLGGEQPTAPEHPAVQQAPEPVAADDNRDSLGAVESQWQALYDSLHTVQGTWHDRLGQVMGLAAASCGVAFVSAHLYCPYQLCFVVLSSGGPQAELLQLGDLHSAEPRPSLPTALSAKGRGGGSAASVSEAVSLQLLLQSKALVHRSVASTAPKPLLSAAQLPPDWRRLHNNAHLTDFVGLPVLDASGTVIAALTVAGPAAGTTDGGDAGGSSGGGGASGGLSAQVPHLERLARVLGLAFFSDQQQLPVYLTACSALAGVQRADSLQALVEAAHEGFGTILERRFRLEGARCVMALADSMEARVAYFAPTAAAVSAVTVSAFPATPGTLTAPLPSGSSVTLAPSGGGEIGSTAAAAAAAASLLRGRTMSCSSQQGPAGSNAMSPAPPLQGVLGPLMDTLLLDVVSREGPGNGRVLTNCRAYLQQEDKPGRDVQVCFQLCRMPPACLALAVAGATDSTLAPEVAVYVCTAQQQLPGRLLEDVRVEVQCVLQLLMPHIHRQLLGPLAAEWAGMRLQTAAGSVVGQGHQSGMSGGGGNSSRGGGNSSRGGGSVGHGGEGSVGSLLTGFSGCLSLGGGGLGRTVSFSVDDLVSHSPAHLKVVVAGIQSTISSAQMNQAWQAAGDTGTRESIDDLYSIRLRETVGQGGQGVVFRGLMHGLEVAVKVVAKDMPGALIAKVQQQQQQQAAAASRRGGGGAAAAAAAAADRPVDPEQVLRTAKRELIRDALELAVTSAVNHPHIVQVHNYFFDVLVVGYAQEDGSGPARLPEAPATTATAAPTSGVSGGTSNYLRLVRRVDATEEMVAEGPTNLVIVMEYCDAGTLKDVLRRGYFRRGMEPNGWSRLDLTSMYVSLLEVALALRHMHSLSLVHCDLKPSNVLLRSQPRDPRGWTCKLSDFGCVRMLRPPAEEGATPAPGAPTFPHFTVTRALGTLTHMAPEVISKGALLTSSVDVYSFGIMMAELVSGVPQDQCLPGKEAIQLARKGVRPTLPPFCPKEYRDVATACWSHDPHSRPTAAELVNVLQMLLNQVQGGPPSNNGVGYGVPSHQQPALQQQVQQHARVAAATAQLPHHQQTAAAPAWVPTTKLENVPAPRPASHGPCPSPGAGRHLATPGTASAPGSGGAGHGATLANIPGLAGSAAAAAAAAAAARVFPGTNASQFLAAAERVLADAGGAAAVMPGGAAGRRTSPQRALAPNLSSTVQQQLMMHQMHQIHQQQLHQQQMIRQVIQQHHQQTMQHQEQLVAQQQQQQTQQHMQQPQQPLQQQQQPGRDGAAPASPVPGAALGRQNSYGSIGGVPIGGAKPSSLISAASAFSAASAASALSRSPSSLSSSARQLRSPAPQALEPASLQLPSPRDSFAATPAAAAAAAGVIQAASSPASEPTAGAAVPVAQPASPAAAAAAAAASISGPTSSPARTDYSSPADQNLSGPCSGGQAAQRAPVGGADGGGGAAGLCGTLDGDLLFNTACSTPMSGAEGHLAAAAAATRPGSEV